jgi:hypothetical protein
VLSTVEVAGCDGDEDGKKGPPMAGLASLLQTDNRRDRGLDSDPYSPYSQAWLLLLLAEEAHRLLRKFVRVM